MPNADFRLTSVPQKRRLLKLSTDATNGKEKENQAEHITVVSSI